MEEVILLYSTDAWHSNSSRELVGVFSSPDELNGYLSKMKKTKRLTDEDIKMLAEHNQTQGNETNYLIETEKVNPQFDNRDIINSLVGSIDGMINVLQLMKESVQEGNYSEADSYIDGMVNDSEELREILEELQ